LLQSGERDEFDAGWKPALLGSVTNLIVAERARSAGIDVSFGTYCLAGVPLTLLSLIFGAWWLS
jgi:Na+/H+ antiporter NhaD/arsenite permease-like protein